MQDPSSLSPVSNISSGDSRNDTPIITDPKNKPSPTPEIPQNTDSSSTDPTSKQALGETLRIRKVKISLGESTDSIVRKLGLPNRVLETEYDFNYYVYNNDYSNLLFVAVKNDKVEGYYTDSTDFSFKNITSGSTLNEINRSLQKSYSLEEVLLYNTKEYTAHILMDKIGTQKAVSVYVLSNNTAELGFSDVVVKNLALLVYDLTNSARVRNGFSVLSWSSSAAVSARKHSQDMAQNKFFDHINLYGQTPGDRIREEGITFYHVGENIIAGYGTAILSNHAWFNSQGHRDTMLSRKFRSLGVGFYYDQNSQYKTYFTQNYYR